MTDARTPAYEAGRRSYTGVIRYGGNPEGIFLARIAQFSSDEERADFEDGWADEAEPVEEGL